MSPKPGMSYNQVKELEKGLLHDAAKGALLGATMVAASTAHMDHRMDKDISNPMNHVQMHDTGGTTQEQPDPTKPAMAATSEKIKSFKQRLDAIRTQMKGDRKPSAITVEPIKE